jgi:uncharacterized membrane-anchored protein YitT (DUF2179 family)
MKMNKFWKDLIIRSVLKSKYRGQPENAQYSEFQLARGHKDLLFLLRRVMKDFSLMTLGVFCAAFGFKGFLLTNGFIDGGATGISLLTSIITGIPLPILIVGINIPFIILGFNTMGRQFAMKTALSIGLLAIVLALVPFPNVTNDNLLVSLFGGMLLGAGIGFSIRGGAVIDGTEVLAIYLSRKFGVTIGDVIIIINILIFSVAAYFLGVEVAMYSMITYFAASRTLDFIIEGIEEYIGVTIVSARNEEIRQMIINQMGRGVTVYTGKRGFGKRGELKEVDIIYTVITRLELNKLNAEIQRIEPTAFVVMNSVKDTRGGMIKKRPLQH